MLHVVLMSEIFLLHFGLKPYAKLLSQRPTKIPNFNREKLRTFSDGLLKSETLLKKTGWMPNEKPNFRFTFPNTTIIMKKILKKFVLVARHLNSNTDQSSEFWPLEPIASQLAGAYRKKEEKSAIDLLYAHAHATLDNRTTNRTGLSSGEKLFAFIERFYGLKDLLNIFRQQM